MTLDGEKSLVDWPGLSKAVKDYKGDDLALDRYEHASINQKEQTVDKLVKSIVKYLSGAFSASYEEDALHAIIEATFTNLKEKKTESDFLSFGKTGGESNSAFQYRVIFAAPMENSTSYFYALVTTIKITADVSNESIFWGLKKTSTTNFGADIDGMELIVQKDYRYSR